MPVHSKYRDARITILSALNRTTSAGLGTRGLAILRGHRIANVDFAVSKYFPIHERMRLQFRMNAVNVLNHPNFALPASNISSPATVGRITSSVAATFGTVAPREVDFQLRLEF